MDFEEVSELLKLHGYKVIETLGKGGFGECLKVYSDYYKQYFACKVVSVECDKKLKKVQASTAEIDMLTHVIHPNIICIFQTIITEKYQLLILEYCPNGDLERYICQNGPLPKDMLFNVMDQLLRALEYLTEKKIAHNDIKPSNIFLDQHNRVKLGDFGSGKRITDIGEKSSDFTGSFAYLAPEVLKRTPYDPLATDIWSFGMTMYRLAFGAFPFSIKDSQTAFKWICLGKFSFPRNADPILKKIISGATALDPTERMSFTDMRQILRESHALEKYSNSQNVTILPSLKHHKSVSAIPNPNGSFISHRNGRFSLRECSSASAFKILPKTIISCK